MSFPLYQEDLCELFERAKCPSIFGPRQQQDTPLSALDTEDLGLKQSIKAMKAIVEAVLYLRLNLVMPCQLRFDYVIRRKKQWGLCHAICERVQDRDSQTQDGYNPEQFQYHNNAEDELVWNMGQIWLRFFTKQPIRIRKMNQNKINAIIDGAVKNEAVNGLLKKVLTRDLDSRMSFQEFVSCESLIPEEEEKSKYFSSVILHLRTLSYIMKTSKNRISKITSRSPYLQELRHRHFMEYLDVDLFLENIKSDIRKAYENNDERQKASCEFTFYVITLQDYANMVKLNAERLEMSEHFDGIEDRMYYSRFTQRMLKLQETLTRKAKLLRNNSYLSPSLLKFVQDPEKMEHALIYEQFKTCVNEYIEYLSDDLKTNRNDLFALKLMAKLYIARTSSYVFAEYRKDVFAPFLQSDKEFSVKKILGRINESKSLEALRELISNIKDFYFKQ